MSRHDHTAGASAPVPTRDSSAWAPFRRRDFRNLWAAQLGSNIGGWMQSVGAQWFLVDSTHSSALVALVQTASLVPVLLLSLVAGVLADSVDRRILLFVSTALSAIAAAVLCVLDWTGHLAPIGLLSITFALGALTALANPAWQAITPDLVPRDEIPAAASLSSVTVNGARAIGPAIAGVLIGFAGPTLVFGLNAISFLGVLIAVGAWHPKVAAPTLGRERFGPALASGLRYVAAAPGVRRVLLRSALFAIPACALWALLPTVASGPLHLNASGYGLLLGVLGIGAVLGVVLMPLLRRRVSNSWILAGSAIVYAAGSAAPALLPLPVVLVLFVLAGIAWIATLTTLNSALQLTLPAWVRARGISVYLMVFMGGQGVASIGWGFLAQATGPNAALLVSAVLLVLVAASVVVLPLRGGIGRRDRTIVALSSANPTLLFEPEPKDGPVVITIRHHVLKGKETDFVTAMRDVERSRRRTGANSWRLDRSGEVADEYREEFTVPSWGEFRRSATERWTGWDKQQLDAALALTDGTATEEHYFPVR